MFISTPLNPFPPLNRFPPCEFSPSRFSAVMRLSITRKKKPQSLFSHTPAPLFAVSEAMSFFTFPGTFLCSACLDFGSLVIAYI